MSIRSYYDLAGFVASALENDPDIGVGVTVALEQPSAEEMPCVRVAIPSAQITPRRLVGGMQSAAPDDEAVTCSLACWAVSGEAADDAYRQADALQQTVREAIGRNRTIREAGGQIVEARATAVEFKFDAQDRGLFCAAIVTVNLWVQS